MIILETIADRWFAFGFVAVFFWAAAAERGWKRSLRFWAVASVVSWMAEYLSTHSPVPYGRYDYQPGLTEAHLANVPLFVPVSFCVVGWAGRALARIGLDARTPGRLILTGALCATALDLVIDPMTLLGGQWFLGPLYQFHATSGWFHVPWSNFVGWFVVSAIILSVDELLERAAKAPPEVDSIRGPTLAAIICVFFIAIAAATGNGAILVGQLVVIGLLAAATGPRLAALVRREAAQPGEAAV